MKRFEFHPTLCVGCFACESACKAKHQLPSGVKWIQVKRIEESSDKGEMRLSFQVKVCQQCKAPPCISSCPTGAIYQRNDGLIMLEGEKCNGCQECIQACPWEAIAFDEARQRASKCNLCADLAEPRCSTYCPTGALTTISPHDAGIAFPPG